MDETKAVSEEPKDSIKRKLEAESSEIKSEPCEKHIKSEDDAATQKGKVEKSDNEHGVDASSHVKDDVIVANKDEDMSTNENTGETPPNDNAAENIAKTILDPLSYTKAEEFTSEIFKIQIHNLPKFGFSQLKKRLLSLGLKPHKLKSPRPQVTYVCFRNQEDRQEAIAKLNGHLWKGRKLEAKEAAPVADPFLQKRQQQREQVELSTKGDSDGITTQEPLTEEEAHKRLKDSVVPLWNVEYPQQLEIKTEKIKSVLKRLTHHRDLRDHFRRMESWNQDGMACPLLPIIPSPVTTEYRNKNEFTIGYAQDGKTIKVGFRHGLYKNGTTTVGEPSGLSVVKPSALPIVKSFEKFVSCSKWAPFLQQAGTGHWHTLTVRTFDSGDVMAMVDFHPRKLDRTELEAARNSVKEFYTSGDGKDIEMKSFYFRLYGKGPAGTTRLEHILGEHYVYENLLGLKFRISPEAFFQVNTQATEKLYSLIGEWSQLSHNSTLLDICCGTGTIGLSLATKVHQVVGVEMCQPAVEDARANAALNGITNASFHCSKVEDVISKILSSLQSSSSSSTIFSSSSSPSDSVGDSQDKPATASAPSPPKTDLVAVVDPPRAGLHKNVIKMLRKCTDIQKLVYVSCNPENAVDNFVDLIRAETGKLRGPPFVLEKAVPIDLFPGTRHCELVLLLTRQQLSTSPECNQRLGDEDSS